jgi:hypothetical protein
VAALTREQVILSAAVVALAFEEPGTISAMEHGAASVVTHGAEHLEHGKLIQMHVKTPAGEKFYKLPIGSLIIKHPPKIHDLHHSKAVQAGEHSYLVPKTAGVMVPKDTDLGDESAVKHAAKHIVLHSAEGEKRHVHISEKGTVTDLGKIHPANQTAFQHDLDEHWKPLHGEAHKPVQFEGKTAAHVPADWNIYKSTGKPDSQLVGKWAHDPKTGKWYLINKASGEIKPWEGSSPENYLHDGKLEPEGEIHAPSAEHVEPVKPGPSKAKVEVGGVPVSHEEIGSAIGILNKDQSTAVKQPLAKAGHPLASMDYHGVSKAVLAKHPELKVPKGTKQQHVGQVKLAVLHHLTELAANFPQDEAQKEVAQETKAEVKAAAVHAQKLTPAVHEIGGVSATTEDVEQAIKHLSATKATAIKQTLQAKGNPLAKTDYWAVVHAHQKAFPESMKGLKAKPVFIAALQHHLDQMGKEDEETGHTQDSALHDLIDKGTTGILDKEKSAHGPVYGTQNEQIASALVQASKSGHAIYVGHVPYAGEDAGHSWVHQFVEPKGINAGPVFYKVKPDHTVTAIEPDGSETEMKPQFITSIAATHIKAAGAAEEEKGEVPAPKLKAEAIPAEKYSEHPGWDKLHTTIVNSEPQIYHGATPDSDSVMGVALQSAHSDGKPWYVLKVGSAYQLSMTPGDQGTFGSPAKDVWWTVTPEHQVIGHTVTGDEIPNPLVSAQGLAEKLPVKQALPEAKPAQEADPLAQHMGAEAEGEKPEVKLWYKGEHIASMPAGTKVYQKPGLHTIQYARDPDGQWWRFLSSGEKQGPLSPAMPGVYDKWVGNGHLKPTTELESGAAGKAAEQEAEKGLTVYYGASGHLSAEVPKGSVVYHGKFATDGNAAIKYVKKPDGTWDVLGYEGTKPADEGLDNLVASGTLVQHQAQAAEPVKGKAIPVWVQGQMAGTVPDGSKMYVTQKDGVINTSAKYVKHPNGDWTLHTADKGQLVPPGTHDYGHYLDNGKLVPAPDQEPDGSVAPEVPKNTVPVTVQGKEVGQAAAGSKVYYSFDQTTADKATTKYTQAPDGTWTVWGAGGKQPGTVDKYYADQYGKYLTAGQFVQEGHETSDQLLMKQIEPDLRTGEIDPQKAPLESLTPEQAIAHAAKFAIDKPHLANSYGQQNPAAAYKMASGKWTFTQYLSHKPSGSGEFYRVENNAGLMKLVHVTEDGKETEEPFQKLADIVGEHVVPNSVIHEGKLYKYGFYYKPKGQAFLEVQHRPATGWSKYSGYKYGKLGKAKWTWHSKDGSIKEISPTQGAKYMAEAPEWHEQAKAVEGEPGASGTAVHYAELLQHGMTYKTWNAHTETISGENFLEPQKDGSLILHSSSGKAALPVHPEHGAPEDAFLKAGTMLDEHGTTVVKPGVEPDNYHLWGSKAMSPDQVNALRMAVEHASGDGPAVVQAMKDHIPGFSTGSPVQKAATAWWADKLPDVNTSSQITSLHGLLMELMNVPHGEPGEYAKAGKTAPEVSYLKGLPPGIDSSKDVFKWADNGNAVLKPSSLPPSTGSGIASLGSLSSPDLSARIKSISEDHGGGKVVGTHVSSLSKQEKMDWLHAWGKGDMQTVFKLDAKGGKVSPAHPGAPANDATHTVSWNPYGAGQVPAATTVEGNWTDPNKVTLPKAEINNYVIKTGLAHPEWLTDAEKRQFVTAHMQHNQALADMWTRLAENRHDSGISTSSETPTWTDNLQPAKSYDTYVEDKIPASSWGHQSTKDYVDDHWNDLATHAAEFGFDKSQLDNNQWTRAKVIQALLDKQQAEEIAEKSKPVWSHTPGGWAPASTNPLLALTRTIPLTGDQTHYFYKPVEKPFRAEVEHAANTLARAFGYQTPDSELLHFEGKYGQAQHKLDAVGDMTYGHSLGFYDAPPVDWSTLSQREISDVAREHLLDWALANDDNRASNMMRMPDGSIVGIDKGRAWRNMHTVTDSWVKDDWDGLSGDEKANSNAYLVVTGLYNAIRDHTVSKATADQAFLDVMQRAQRMQKLPDDRVRDIVSQGIANRPKLDDAGRAQLAQAVVDRKNGLAADFQDLWGRVYKDAGWTLPEVPQFALSESPQGVQLHSGFSEPDFLDDVAASKSYGTPAFFGGPELEDGNFLVWHELAGTGSGTPLIKGESFVRGPALAKMESWAQANKTADPMNAVVHQAPDPSSTVLPDEHDYYNKIIAAAKTVSHHVTDKQFNPSKIAAMQQVKSSLNLRQQVADEAKNDPAKAAAMISNNLGNPHYVSDMASLYLAHIGKIEEAMDSGHKFQAGELPQWAPSASLKSLVEAAPKPAEPELPAKPPEPPVKVVLKNASRPLATGTGVDSFRGETFDADGRLHTGSKTSGLSTYDGQTWHITLPTGEEIQFSGTEDAHGINLAHEGRIRFSTPDNSSASLERIRSHLQGMGLDMREADDHDLELFYWRHLANILANRKDSTVGKHADVWHELESQMQKNAVPGHLMSHEGHAERIAAANLPPDVERTMWHAAWSKLTSPAQVKAFSDARGWSPRLDHYDLRDPERVQGKPYWLRFDVTPDQAAQWKMPTMHSANSEVVANRIVKSGGRFSTEARLRTLGSGVTGMSSSSDMEKGSSGTIFTRLNQETSGQVLLNPSVLARTSTYSFPGDKYGNINLRDSLAPFNPESAAKMGASSSGDSNETMVKDAVSLLDGVELMYAPDTERAQLLSYLHGLGIDQIRGVPVEDRIVSSINSHSADKVRKAYQQNLSHMGWWHGA